MTTQSEVAGQYGLDTPDYPCVGDYLTHWAGHCPEREAVVFNGSRMAYGELETLVDRVATGLLEFGIKPGERVGMLSTPRPEFFVVFLATVRIGGVWLGLNPKYTLDELRYVVGDAAPRLLIAPEWIEERDGGELARTLADECPATEDVRVLSLGPAFDADLLMPLMGDAKDRLPERKSTVASQDPALLVYTSGTTGKPKGALLPHRGLVYCGRVQRTHLRADPLRMLNNLPVNHVGCVGDVSVFTLVSGGTIVFAERFEPGSTGPLLRDEGITLWGQVPTMFQLTLDDPGFEPQMAIHVQEIAWSGAMAPKSLVARLETICPRLSSFYGMTETVGSVCYSDPGASLDDLARTVGRPDPHFEVRIADADGEPVAPGIDGEIQVRGDFIMRGYLNRPDATSEALTSDGWLKTGDAAVEEPDGQYRLIGRLKEMFKSGGYNVYPREVENVIESFSAVASAAVVATPDPLYNEVGTAFLVWKSGENGDVDALIAHCRAHLANYKLPKRIQVLDQLPMLRIGKVDRSELKRRAKLLPGNGEG